MLEALCNPTEQHHNNITFSPSFSHSTGFGIQFLLLLLVLITSMEDLIEFIVDAGLTDVGFFGNQFTWANNRKDLAYVYTKMFG